MVLFDEKTIKESGEFTKFSPVNTVADSRCVYSKIPESRLFPGDMSSVRKMLFKCEATAVTATIAMELFRRGVSVFFIRRWSPHSTCHPPTSPGSSRSGPTNKAAAHHASAIGIQGLVAVPSSGPPLREQAIQEGFVL